MQISEAQKEVRTVYMGAFAGFIVTGLIWGVSATLGTWSSKNLSIMALILGGTFIFPLTQLLLKIMGKPTTLRKENPFSLLAMQIAFTIPATYPLIAAAASNNINWFFPAFLVVVGAHYLPFIFLYGMWQFLIVAVALIAFGTGIGYYFPDSFTLGGWVGAGTYLIFAFPFKAFAQKK